MKNSKLVRGLATLAVCALVLPTIGSLKNPVERPFKAVGIISFTPASASAGTFGVDGNATHLGDFVGNGTYQIYDVVGSKVYMHVTATWTAANGGTIEFDMPEWVIQYDASGNAVSSTGLGNVIRGTGRFAHASGSMFSEISPAQDAPGVTQIVTGEGTISY